ncbi:MAG: hypothetical protein NTU62_04415, partial [Spirochaetes bacterium]|nr:hypothetical protein [Spirochaetota bacterium]
MRHAPTDELPPDPPSDWQIVRDAARRFYGKHRVAVILAANAAFTVAALLVFNALRPMPAPVTQRMIDRA